jgi:hypothetical protein
MFFSIPTLPRLKIKDYEKFSLGQSFLVFFVSDVKSCFLSPRYPQVIDFILTLKIPKHSLTSHLRRLVERFGNNISLFEALSYAYVVFVSEAVSVLHTECPTLPQASLLGCANFAYIFFGTKQSAKRSHFPPSRTKTNKVN